MPQIFAASADTWLRASVLVVGLVFFGVFGGGMLVGSFVGSDYLMRAGWPVSQPVPFSHKHHVGDLGLDCRYCHMGVETSANAGFPSTSTCMTCHSQLWTGAEVLAPVRASLASGRPLVWNRVSQVPDYVYFNHAIHVDRGVPCVQCHGRIDRMPLTWRAKPFQMQFCINCHRDPAPNLRPKDQVTRMDWTGWDEVPAHRGFGAGVVRALRIDPGRITNCEVCHR
jgi:hypothetical protein